MKCAFLCYASTLYLQKLQFPLLQMWIVVLVLVLVRLVGEEVNLADTILRHDAEMSPVSTYVNINFFTDINGTKISPHIFIGYSEQLWQLERRDQVLRKEVLNYKRGFLICTPGIKETMHNFINVKEILYVQH